MPFGNDTLPFLGATGDRSAWGRGTPDTGIAIAALAALGYGVQTAWLDGRRVTLDGTSADGRTTPGAAPQNAVPIVLRKPIAHTGAKAAKQKAE